MGYNRGLHRDNGKEHGNYMKLPAASKIDVWGPQKKDRDSGEGIWESLLILA